MVDPEASFVTVLTIASYPDGRKVRVVAGPELPPEVNHEQDVAIVVRVAGGIPDEPAVVHMVDVQVQVFGPSTVIIREVDQTVFDVLDGKAFPGVKRVFRSAHPVLVRDPRTLWLYSVSTYRAFCSDQ